MPVEDWTPTVADVGAVLRSRTVNRHGAELGTFTAETRPTEAQVLLLVPGATGAVAAVIGDDVAEEWHDDAAGIAAIGTAMQIELTYYPEQIGTGRSPYDELKELYEDRLRDLRAAIIGGGGDLPAGEGDEAPPDSPVMYAPDRTMLGFGTLW